MAFWRVLFYTVAALTAVMLQPVAAAAPTWTVAVYMCGTDLESKYGAGTADLQEMIAGVGGEVNVIVQTGGALGWHNNTVPTGKVARYAVDGRGLRQLAVLPDADMGSGQTLMDFVAFVAREYPAERNMLVLWDHGGGALPGVCMDERTRNMIPLADVRTAIAAVHPVSAHPFFDIVGMDACLMGAAETAASLRGLADYLVASEEWEPGGGWMYTAWLKAIAANPDMPTEQLGQVIVDAYMADCKRLGQEAMATQAVIACGKADDALAALDGLAPAVTADPAGAYRAAAGAENYGGNTPAQGYANMVDAVDFAQRLAPGTPATANLVNVVDNMVVAHAGGAMRNRGHGLSVYFPLDGDPRSLNAYARRAGAGVPQALLNAYGAAVGTPRRGATADNVLDGVGVDIDGVHAQVTVDREALAQTRAVSMAMVYPDTEAGVMLHLGSCAQVDVDYRRGVVTERLHGTWPALDGHMLFTEVVDVDDKYALLASPVMVNGQRYALLLREDRATGELSVIGLRPPRHADGVVDRGLTQLKPDDHVTLLHRAALLGGEGDFTEVQLEKLVIGTKGPQVASVPLDDGVYAACFEFTDLNGAVHRSSLAKYVVTDGHTAMYTFSQR